MSGIKEILQEFGINIPIIVAGIVGGFVSISDNKGLKTREKITALLVGGAVANYVTPFLVILLNWSSASNYGFAFLIGISGKSGAEFIIKKLKDKYSKNDEIKQDS